MTHLRRLLVVDDDPSGRTMLSLSLRQAGYAVQAAQSGEEALRLIGKSRFDWLITDAKMEPMDGFELSVLAKKLQPDLHVLMISAVYTEKDTEGFPIEKFLPKPIQVEELLGQIQRV